MPDDEKKQKINPEVTDIEIGIRYLRNVTFYPLSAAHQLKMTDIIKQVFAEMANMDQEEGDESLVLFFNKVLEIVKENIESFVEMVSDEVGTKLLEEISNSQLVEVIHYVYKTNFEGPLKNLMAPFQEGDESQGNLIQSVLSQLSPQSAKSTATDLKMSTEKVTEKAG